MIANMIADVIALVGEFVEDKQLSKRHASQLMDEVGAWINQEVSCIDGRVFVSGEVTCQSVNITDDCELRELEIKISHSSAESDDSDLKTLSGSFYFNCKVAECNSRSVPTGITVH